MKKTISPDTGFVPPVFTRCTLAALVATGALLALPSLSAQTVRTWTGGTSGTFSVGSNWSGGTAPGAADVARFNHSAPTTITFTQATTDVLRLANGATNNSELIFELGGNTLNALTTSGSFGEEFGLLVSGASDHARTTILRDGIYNMQRMSVGYVWANVGTLRLQDGVTVDTSLVDAPTTQTSFIGGPTGAGELYIESGSSLITRANVIVGNSGATASGLVSISGAGSTWNANHNSTIVRLGDDGHATLLISDGGTMNAHTIQTQFWTGASKTTTVSVTGTGSSLSATSFTIGGTNTNTWTSVSVADSASMTLGTMVLRATAELSISNATVSLANNSTLNAGADLAITLHGPAQPLAIDAAAGLTITNSELSLSLAPGFSANINDVIVLAEYSTLTGTFDSLPNLSNIDIGAYSFQINYNYNSLDQIALVATAIPEPGSLGLLLFATGGLLCARVRHRARHSHQPLP